MTPLVSNVLDLNNHEVITKFHELGHHKDLACANCEGVRMQRMVYPVHKE